LADFLLLYDGINGLGEFGIRQEGGGMHILMTVNAAWNIWNFRRPLVGALVGDGHRVTVLAPPDDAVPELERLGCRVRPPEMSVKGLNPLADLKLQRRYARIFREERPNAVLSYTIKNNIFGARAAQSAGVPFLPNVTGLGTAFLSGKLLQAVTAERVNDFETVAFGL
jgi:hypothetical protein